MGFLFGSRFVPHSSISQGLARWPYILSDLANTSNASRIKEVTAPSISRRYIIENDRVNEYGGWRYDIGGGGVFVEGQAGAECADGRETRGDDTTTKVPEEITHLIICLYKEYRVLVEFDGEKGDDAYRFSGFFWDRKLGGDLERAL